MLYIRGCGMLCFDGAVGAGGGLNVLRAEGGVWDVAVSVAVGEAMWEEFEYRSALIQ